MSEFCDYQVSSVVRQQIGQTLGDVGLTNSSISTHNKTLISPSINQTTLSSPILKTVMNTSLTSGVLQKFTFDYFCERLNIHNYKDICKRRDEQELKREETVMRLPIVE